MRHKRCDDCGGKLSPIPGTRVYGCLKCDQATWAREYASLLRSRIADELRHERARDPDTPAVCICGKCERPVEHCECLDLCPICKEEFCDGHDCIPF